MSTTAEADAASVAILPTPYYQDDAVTIYHGDCREILPTLGRFDLLLTDPPYGLNEKLRGGKSGMMGGCFNEMVDMGWDVRPDSQTILALIAKADNYVIWGANYFCESIKPNQCFLVWDKMNGTNQMADCEMAMTTFRGGARMFSRHHFSRGCRGKSHPTQKPLPVIQWCLSFAPDAETILDPFAGSGTTGVAAKLEGRKATLIEIEESYCEIAANRISQGVLF
jgi:DNA modification methylase